MIYPYLYNVSQLYSPPGEAKVPLCTDKQVYYMETLYRPSGKAIHRKELYQNYLRNSSTLNGSLVSDVWKKEFKAAQFFFLFYIVEMRNEITLLRSYYLANRVKDDKGYRNLSITHKFKISTVIKIDNYFIKPDTCIYNHYSLPRTEFILKSL